MRRGEESPQRGPHHGPPKRGIPAAAAMVSGGERRTDGRWRCASSPLIRTKWDGMQREVCVVFMVGAVEAEEAESLPLKTSNSARLWTVFAVCKVSPASDSLVA